MEGKNYLSDSLLTGLSNFTSPSWLIADWSIISISPDLLWEQSGPFAEIAKSSKTFIGSKNSLLSEEICHQLCGQLFLAIGKYLKGWE